MQNRQNIQKDKDDDSWLNAGCIEIPDGPVLMQYKLFDKICYGYDEDNFYLRFYLNRFVMEDSELNKHAYQTYVYTRNRSKNHPLSPSRLINKVENVLPPSVEKFHNEFQFIIQGNELKYVRHIKSMPGEIWALQSPKDIKTDLSSVFDVSIPFDIMEIKHGEALEFMVTIAHYGIREFNIPNEVLLTVPRL